MSSSEPAPALPFAVTSGPDVRITVYDADCAKVHGEDGVLTTALPRGLYRVQLERAGRVETHLLDHDGATDLRIAGPDLATPALLEGAVTTHDYYTVPA